MTGSNENSSPDEIPSKATDARPSGSRKKYIEATKENGQPTFLAKWSTTILCVTLFLAPLVIMGSIKSLRVSATDIRQWLPTDFEEAVTYDKFLDRFGIDEMVVLSWEDCKLGNPEVTQLRKAFQEATLPDPAGEDLPRLPAFSKVMSGEQMLYQLKDSGLPEIIAKKRMQGLLVGPDLETTCIVAFPSKKLVDSRRLIIGEIYNISKSELGLEASDLKLGGPTADGAAIQVESQKSLKSFLWMSVGLVFCLTWFRLRDLPLSLIVIFFAGFCAAISLAFLYWTGGKMNLTMVMLPTLTFILGVSGCIHMVNYYRKASTLGYGINSADQSIVDGGYPVALSSATTAIGLLSLATSQVVPIRLFGIYSALGIFTSISVMLLILPATLYLMRGRISKRFSNQGSMSKRERTSGVSRSTSLLMHWVYRSHWFVVVPCLLGVTLLATGVFQLGASVKLQNRFAQRAKIITDYQWLETKLGSLVPMEVVLEFDEDNQFSNWQRMQVVKSVEQAIKQTTAISATLSVASFEPRMPRGSNFRDKLKRKTKLDVWNKNYQKFEDAKLVKTVGDKSYWRISLRVAALNDIDYGDFLETVSKNVNYQMEHLKLTGVSAQLTGGIPLVYKAQHQILQDLMYSFLTAFLIISIIMMVVLKSFWAGLVAMIPNVFPPLVVFGAMGWLGISIEIGSVMTASVALGIAVDDTLHFLTWYRRGTQNGLSRYSSIRFAFDHCAKAMIDTSLICGLGVMPFVFGIFMPTAKFAALLMIMLLTALLGDLLLLPAILAGPAGRLFRLKSVKKRGEISADPPLSFGNQRRDAAQSSTTSNLHTEPLNTARRK
ncbi:MAG: MMPL family transporter [Mariniblastus sp.]|nr:MMPL family transporter [Mariniblastus sp.]MDG2183397.1 MMPL family transporter [Mariniblastus sp.]